ncbi:MAG: hypothetical protein GY730_05665, partial [bacterium]|nr:hypothetical protein [bacterium]
MTAILKIKNLFVFICFILCLLPAAQVHAGSDLAGTIILVDFYSDKVSEYIDAGDNDSAEASLYYLQKHIKNLELYKEVKDLTVDNTGLITTRLEKYENILNDLADIRYSSPDNSDGNYKNNKGQDKFSVSYLDTVYSNSQSSIIQAGFVYNPVKGVKGNSVIQYSDGNFKNLYYQFDNQINVNEQKVNIDISGMAFHHDPYSDYVNLNLHSRNDIKLYGFSNFRLYSGIQSQFSQNSNDNFYLLTLSGYENQPEGGLEFTYRLNKASKTTSSYHHLGFGLDRPDQFEFFDYIYGYNCNISTWLFPDDDIRNSCIFSYKQNLKKRFSSIDSEVYVYYQLQRSSDSYVGLFNQYNLFYNKGLDFMRLNMDMEYYPGSDADYIRLGLNKSLPGLDKPE